MNIYVDKDKCVACGMCVDACPLIQPRACWNCSLEISILSIVNDLVLESRGDGDPVAPEMRLSESGYYQPAPWAEKSAGPPGKPPGRFIRVGMISF